MNMAATKTTPTATFWLTLARNAKISLYNRLVRARSGAEHAQTPITAVVVAMFLARANYLCPRVARLG
jgi:hypothetical protein